MTDTTDDVSNGHPKAVPSTVKVEEAVTFGGVPVEEEEGEVLDSSEGYDDKSGAVPGQKLQAKWDEMYSRLLAFREKHGHCLVPNRYQEDPQLGSWVSTQRRHYKILTSGSGESTPMTPARAQKLVDIGFKWSTKDPRHVPWEHRYGELVSFKEKYGHAQVPIGWEENVQLSNWVSTQRQEYKLIQRGRQSRLTDERIKLLNKIEFIWEAQRGGPRRKRKATVAVPPKANPVDIAKLRAKTSTRGRGGSAAGGATTNSQGENGEQGNSVDLAPALAALGGAANVLPASLLLPAQQWQLLASGAFQKTVPQVNLDQAASLFPLASQIPLATAGFQFGINPLAAQLAALQQQQQAALLLNAGVMAASASMEQDRKKKKQKTSDGEEDEDGSEKPSASEKPKTTESSGDDNEKDVFYDADE